MTSPPTASAATAAVAMRAARARAAFDAAVAAAAPGPAVLRALAHHPLPNVRGRRILIAAGKAAGPMALALCGGPWDEIVVVSHAPVDLSATGTAGRAVHIAGHPEPDAAGAAAAARLLAIAGSAGPDDLILLALSGGASAMLPAPVPPLTLEDKIAVNRLLLASGLDIRATNLVRQSLSRIKGGGLARAAAPAAMVCLALSDVPGDDPRVIGSGPAVPPIGTPGDARDLLRDAGLWDRLPPRVRDHLADAPRQSPTPAVPIRVVGSNAHSVAAAAASLGTDLTATLTGDVAVAASTVAAAIRAARPGTARVWGGETTVTLRGTGTGGRNQELALRVAAALAGQGGWTFVSGGTDGRDGPTEAAGGLVDGDTVARAAANGVDVAAALANNDSHAALAAAGGLLITGPTGTNVADIQVALVD